MNIKLNKSNQNLVHHISCWAVRRTVYRILKGLHMFESFSLTQGAVSNNSNEQLRPTLIYAGHQLDVV